MPPQDCHQGAIALGRGLGYGLRAMKAILKLVLLVLLLAAAAAFLRVRWDLGQFSTLPAPTPLPVQLLLGDDGKPVTGAEEIVVDRVGRRLYLSTYDRRAARDGQDVRGHLYVVALDDSALTAHDITPAEPAIFRPHGMALYRDASGVVSLYVVNHPGTFDDVVELYDLAPDGTATHRETIADSAFVSLNDLTIVGPRQFYATNDHGHKTGFRRDLELWLHTNESGVIYFDGSVATPVAGGLNFANGIAASPDGAQIYVAETLSRRIRIYRRDAATNNLNELRTVAVDSGVDNIDVDSEGQLWIGAHPQMYKLFAFVGDPSRPSAAQALRIDLETLLNPNVQTVFFDDGKRVNSSSTAVFVDGRVFIGSVFGPAAMVTLP